MLVFLVGRAVQDAPLCSLIHWAVILVPPAVRVQLLGPIPLLAAAWRAQSTRAPICPIEAAPNYQTYTMEIAADYPSGSV
jgi:hypothetical protein